MKVLGGEKRIDVGLKITDKILSSETVVGGIGPQAWGGALKVRGLGKSTSTSGDFLAGGLGGEVWQPSLRAGPS